MKKKQDTEVDIKSQVEEVKDFVHSDEFKDIIKEAAPHRLEIMLEHTPEMKEIKQEFVDYMNNAAKDCEDFDEKEFSKKFRKIFKKTVDYFHYLGGWPKETTPAKLETLADNVEIALKYLDFMQCREFRDRLEARGIFIDDKKSKTLKDDYPSLNSETWENFRSMIEDGSNCQSKICDSADKIKVNIFEDKIPEEVRFSSENKCGIKKGAFNKLVTAEAMKSQKTEEKMEKALTKLAENSEFSIAREEIMTERYSDMLSED